MFARPCDVLSAAPNDVRADKVNISQCKGSKRKAGNDPESVLLPAEKQRLRAYGQAFDNVAPHSKCAEADLICHLGDSPQTGWTTWSAKSSRIPTIRRSGSLYWALGIDI